MKHLRTTRWRSTNRHQRVSRNGPTGYRRGHIYAITYLLLVNFVLKYYNMPSNTHFMMPKRRRLGEMAPPNDNRCVLSNISLIGSQCQMRSTSMGRSKRAFDGALHLAVWLFAVSKACRRVSPCTKSKASLSVSLYRTCAHVMKEII